MNRKTCKQGNVRRCLLRRRVTILVAVCHNAEPIENKAPASGNEFVKTLLSETQLQEGIERLAGSIRDEYQDRSITIIAIMTGSLVLLADLIRRLDMPIRISLIQASSYRGGTSSGEMHISQSMMLDIADRECVLLDDIFDTGRTLVEVSACLQKLKPTSLKSAVLLLKEGQSVVAVEPDYVAFRIPNEFVVGYGLDYEDHYRNLPFVAVMEPQDLTNAL